MTNPTHIVTFNGHFRFEGSFTECNDWLLKRSGGMSVSVMLKSLAYKLEKIEEKP